MSKKRNLPRAHHYVPQFFLAGFTDTGEREGMLYVYDLETGNKWKGNPRSVANEKDFYISTLTHRPADEIEKLLCHVEAESSVAIKKLINGKTINGPEMSRLMDFIALMMIRVPTQRDLTAKISEMQMRQFLRLFAALSDDELLEKFEQFKKDDKDFPNITPEEFRKFVNSDEYDIEFGQSWHMRTFVLGYLANLESFARILLKRSWILNSVQKDAGNFVCTDNPSIIDWIGEPNLHQPPGLALDKTIVTMPISRSLAFTGTFEKLPGSTYRLNAEGVAHINTILIQQAKRFVYSPTENFAWIKPDGSIGNATELLPFIKEWRKSD